MAFGIAEAAVEFDHLRSGCREHQTGVNHPAVVDTAVSQGFQDGLKHQGFNLEKCVLIQKWGWGISAHPSGVGSLIAVLEPFVVLGWGKENHAFAITEGEHRNLRAFESFLQHELGSSRTKTPLEGLLNGGFCFGHCFGHRDPFARC